MGTVVDIFLGCIAAGLKSYRLLPSSDEVKNAWRYTSTPPYVFMACYLLQQNGLTTHLILLLFQRNNLKPSALMLNKDEFISKIGIISPTNIQNTVDIL